VDGVTLPNFLYIGPDKAGSSWLHEALLHHPEIYLSEAKDLYFFDRYYDRGLGWYEFQFRGAAAQHKVVGEVCPDYLADPRAAERIRECLPEARLMVTLREPVSRAFSSYLYMRKHGLGPSTFRQALDSFPDLVEHGRYATQLRRYEHYFVSGRLHAPLFDDLQGNPQAFVDDTAKFVGLSPVTLDEETLSPRLAASKARVVPLAWTVRQSAALVRRYDGARLVGRVKRSRLVHKALYRPLGGDAPKVQDADRAYIQEELSGEVARLESDFGIPVRERWGW
jgi:hypothetical protein